MRRAFVLASRLGPIVLAAMLLLEPSPGTAQVAPAGAPVRDASAVQAPTGTGRLSISVVATATGAPVKRVQTMLNGTAMSALRPAGTQTATSGAPAISASVQLYAAVEGGGVTSSTGAGPSPVPGRVQKDGETDERGRIEFTGLPAGYYNVMVSPPAGFVRPRQSQSIRLNDGESASLTVRLDRAGAITGVIVDEAGDPVSRASVRAVGKGINGVAGRLSSTGYPGTTDDRGEFRIYDLAPGDYFVSATYFHPSAPMFPSSSPAGEARIGYVPTYYPGAPSLEGARPVTVRAGQDSPGVNFGLLQGRLGRVSGTAMVSTGHPIATRGSVSLILRSPDPFGRAPGGAIRPDGTFAIENVPPGDYFLTAYSFRGDGAMADREGAFVPVSVNGDDVSVSIRTNTGATLSGRVIIEGTMPAAPGIAASGALALPPQLSSVRVSTRPATDAVMLPGFAPGRSEPVAEDGTFQITGVRGSVLLTAMGPVGVLKAIRRGADDLTSSSLELAGTERIDDIEIILTTDTGTLTGMVTDSRGGPAPGAWVLAFTDNPKYWYLGSHLVRPARAMSIPTSSASLPAGAMQPRVGSPQPGAMRPPGASGVLRAPGAIRIINLLPGRYYVVAWENENDTAGLNISQFDAETLSKLRQKATSVTIEAGETATVTVRVTKEGRF